MARVKHGIVMKRRESTPEPGVRSELRSACKADDVQRVAELLNGNSVTVADASECVEETTQNLPLMRLLLEHGADPAACATTRCMGESIELIKLLVEFGHDIKTNGHWVLQYVIP
jgi:aconitase A